MNRYWYDRQTGKILHRTLAKSENKFDLPYFDRDEQGFVWSNYKVDLNTGELIEDPDPNGQGQRTRGV